ncbi:hypothetical protein DITRI_Ditri06bG0098400 [Diplodiscus trichospermus]
MWPLIETRKVDWYPTSVPPSNMHGLQCYKVFIAIAMILGDGLYNFFKVLSRTLTGLFYQIQGKQALPMANQPFLYTSKKLSSDDQLRTQLFPKDQIPKWFSATGYVTIAAISIIDFKTGYLTLASPMAMFISQVIGTAIGCIVSPCVFWLLYNAFDDLGFPDSQYPAPFAVVYRNMSILKVQGFSALPKNYFLFCYVFFGTAIAINFIKDKLGKKWGSFIPLPMAMAIPFYLGPYFAIDMCVGSLILFVWE